jgi:hypothetical protein
LKATLILTLLAGFTGVWGNGKLAAQNAQRRFGEPLVVLKESHPGSKEMELNEPDFVIYSSGQVIYRKQQAQQPVFRQEQLSRIATQQLIFALDLTDSLLALPDQITASNLKDQIEYQLLLNFDSVKLITIYGNILDTLSAARSLVPTALLRAIDNLMNFGNSTDPEWIPEQFEIIFSIDPANQQPPVLWPSGWPDLNDSAAVKRHPDLYSIFMDKSWYPTFLAFMKKMGPGQDVIIDGKKGRISFRFPFPQL